MKSYIFDFYLEYYSNFRDGLYYILRLALEAKVDVNLPVNNEKLTIDLNGSSNYTIALKSAGAVSKL